jgi:hypothetical protein
VFLRSANRATLYTTSENSFFSIEIFIRYLLGVLILGRPEKSYIDIVYFYIPHNENLLISV